MNQNEQIYTIYHKYALTIIYKAAKYPFRADILPLVPKWAPE
jgi:hypothetical protein